MTRLLLKAAMVENEIPEYMHGGMIAYVHDHRRPGDFLMAVLSNDLRGAVDRADYTNIKLLDNYVRVLYNHAPATCWGSQARVEKWLS